MSIRAVIMAGGSGTRFWPRSRQKLPKQFLRFGGEESLMQQAIARILPLCGADGIYVITSSAHVAKTLEQAPMLTPEQVFAEPMGRDTAACIGVTAAVLARKDPETPIVVLSADHLIQPESAFRSAVLAAANFARENPATLVTFGIRPNRPATGYGYLRRGPIASSQPGAMVYRLRSFHEKPNLETAQRFVASEEYYWNAGIFCWQPRAILAELARHSPSIFNGVCKIADRWDKPDRLEVFQQEFAKLPKISIDFAVMERATDIAMVEGAFEWDDVGSWLALERVLPSDGAGNVILGQHVGIETRNCVVAADDRQLIATIGVSDLIIVQADGVTLVANRKDEQSVKQLLAQLEARGMTDYL